MKQKTLMIAFSCAIGAGIGYLLAKSLGSFWTVGILIGGLIGYVSYDFKKVLSAIPEAFNHAKEKVGNLDFAKSLRKATRFIFYASWIFLIPMGSMFYFMERVNTDIYKLPVTLVLLIMGYITIHMIVCTLFVLTKHSEEAEFSMDPTFLRYYKRIGFWSLAQRAKASNFLFVCTLCLSPFISVYFFLRISIELCVWAGKKVWNRLISTKNFVFQFFWKLFKLIHTEIRILVGVDSIIGGLIGFLYLPDIYLLGINITILACMLIGAILGVFNYQIVSIKMLKLKPKY